VPSGFPDCPRQLADAIKEFYDTPTPTAEIRQLLDSATQMLALGLSLAGAAVGHAGTKTLLAGPPAP